jgi:hypothetical protein
MKPVQSQSGREYRFVRETFVTGRRLSIWAASCDDCERELEITAPPITKRSPRIDVQGAIDSGVWAKFFAYARCRACRLERRAR